VAAVLTIVGYSINDTIVIFDRVRENRGLMRDADLATLLNTSITQTMGRTILTSLTVFLSIIALFVLGWGDIRNFALLMLVGIFEGAYSTIFIASPIVYMWTRGNDRRRKARDLAKYGRGMAAAPERRAAEQPEPEVAEEPPIEAAAEEAAGIVAEASPEAPGPENPTAAYQPPQNPQASPPAGVTVPSAGGGSYVRLQRRHKKRKR
jgi:hypothetical protein